MTATERLVSRTPATDTPWMKLPEVMAYARIGRTEIITALNDGALRGHQTKRGGTWRIHRDEVDAWLRGYPVGQAS